MKITSKYPFQTIPSLFYKATSGGVQKCIQVTSKVNDWTIGYIVDSLFQSLNEGKDFIHFDNPNTGFFTEESEAIEFHRQLVLNYINGLNHSSLKTCPIVIQ